MKRLSAILAIGLMATAAFAEAPDSSLRPRARPAVETIQIVDPASVAPDRGAGSSAENAVEADINQAIDEAITDAVEEAISEADATEQPTAETDVIEEAAIPAGPNRAVRPRARPAGLTAPDLRPAAEPELKPAPEADPSGPVLQAALAPHVSVRPKMRPAARPAQPTPEAKPRAGSQPKPLPKVGMICDDPDIIGAEIGDIAGKLVGCGLADAVSVRQVAGIQLSQRATMDCTTARTLKTWIEKGMKPAIRRKGGGVAQIRVAAHYSCRPRNNKRGAKISEHGRGRAIDISGFRLRDGTEITVAKHYDSWQFGPALRRMRKDACGPFGTVLGPGSDGYHNDHFHFDTARHQNGSYCR